MRLSAADGELVDEKLSVKIISTSGSGGGPGSEVLASYLVDEHQLEIRIRIPSDWPLHRVEVKDVKRVGVDENRWRAWVLGVQQTIWAHVSCHSYWYIELVIMIYRTEWEDS